MGYDESRNRMIFERISLTAHWISISLVLGEHFPIVLEQKSHNIKLSK